MKPDYYECDICGHLHPWTWSADCRDDANRLTWEALPATAKVATMAGRVAADSNQED